MKEQISDSLMISAIILKFGSLRSNRLWDWESIGPDGMNREEKTVVGNIYGHVSKPDVVPRKNRAGSCRMSMNASLSLRSSSTASKELRILSNQELILEAAFNNEYRA